MKKVLFILITLSISISSFADTELVCDSTLINPGIGINNKAANEQGINARIKKLQDQGNTVIISNFTTTTGGAHISVDRICVVLKY